MDARYSEINAGWPAIGAAEYFVRQQVQTRRGQRGVYSFCMCPGGFVLPSPTSVEHLNVNGMSNSNRGGRFGNAALVVQVQPERHAPRVEVPPPRRGYREEQAERGAIEHSVAEVSRDEEIT